MFTPRERDTSMIPKAIDNSKLPFDVSSDIAVVNVLVLYRMFPPTIMARPISEIARPKPNIMAVDMPYLASLIMARMVCILFAPIETAVSRISAGTLFNADIVSPVIIGDISMM